MNEEAQSPVADQFLRPHAGSVPDTTNPLYGVHGWLKFMVVMNLYVGPVIFGLRQILAWIGYTMLADEHPGIILVGLIDTAAGVKIDVA